MYLNLTHLKWSKTPKQLKHFMKIDVRNNEKHYLLLLYKEWFYLLNIHIE